MNYDDLYNKSTETKNIEKRKWKVVDKKQFLKANIISIAILITVTKGTLGIAEFVHNRDIAMELSMHSATEMIQAGYRVNTPPGSVPDSRYYLIDDMDMFSVLAGLGYNEAESVLKSRGFNSWDEYAKSEGFENFDDWNKTQVENYKEERSQAKGGI